MANISILSRNSLEGKSDKEFLDEILHIDKYDKRILPPVVGKCCYDDKVNKRVFEYHLNKFLVDSRLFIVNS